jgi:hypothetical protein
MKGVPAGNILLSSVILLTGATYQPIRDLADILNLSIMCERSFYRYQSSIIFPSINAAYNSQKQTLISAIDKSPVRLYEIDPLCIVTKHCVDFSLF